MKALRAILFKITRSVFLFIYELKTPGFELREAPCALLTTF